jgi:hypothetical protein
MSAWGYGPFQNELAQDYVSHVVVERIHPLLVEAVDHDTQHTKHKWAYYYDRFRAAVELMILLETSGAYKFSVGFYDLAIEKLRKLRANTLWSASWDNVTHSKSANYQRDVDRQIGHLTVLRAKARP